jgi:hypothetical protein
VKDANLQIMMMNMAIVIDIWEPLFGELPILDADADDSTEVERRRKLVATVRLLLASVGIDYEVAR